VVAILIATTAMGCSAYRSASRTLARAGRRLTLAIRLSDPDGRESTLAIGADGRDGTT